MEALENIGSVLGTIGDFIISIPQAISNIFTFVYQCINECSALLGVIPSVVATLMTSALIFSIVLAVKRLVID